MSSIRYRRLAFALIGVNASLLGHRYYIKSFPSTSPDDRDSSWLGNNGSFAWINGSRRAEEERRQVQYSMLLDRFRDSCLTNPVTNPADLLIPDNDTVLGDIETRRTRQEADGSPAYDNDNLGYTIAQSPGKGIGVFATRFIPAGSKILDEKPVLTLPAGGDGAGKQMLRPSDLQAFIAQVFGLSPALRQAVVNLQGERVALWKPQMEHYRQILGREEFPVVGDTADGGVIAHRPLSVDERAQLEHILRVFYTNAAALVAPVQVAPLHPPPSLSLSFQSSAPQRTTEMAHVGDGLFLTFSRINHSCEANAVWDTCRQPGIMSIRAARDIRPGEEITISYFWETAETVEKRRERTKGWGFVCQCLKCGPLGEQWS